MFCKNCGIELNDGMKFCPQCGTPNEFTAQENDGIVDAVSGVFDDIANKFAPYEAQNQNQNQNQNQQPENNGSFQAGPQDYNGQPGYSAENSPADYGHQYGNAPNSYNQYYNNGQPGYGYNGAGQAYTNQSQTGQPYINQPYAGQPYGNAPYGAPAAGSAPQHPYHVLGGWLEAYVVVSYIGVVLTIIGCILNVVSVASVVFIWGISGGLKAGLVGLTLIAVAALVLNIMFVIRYLKEIRTKNPQFLWTIHKTYIILVIEMILLSLISIVAGTGFISAGSIIIEIVKDFLYVAVCAFLVTLYMVKSVRVRTYMGTDEYLRISPFTRNCKSPVPADAAPGNYPYN